MFNFFILFSVFGEIRYVYCWLCDNCFIIQIMSRIQRFSLLLYCIVSFCNHAIAKPRSFHEEIRSPKHWEESRSRMIRDVGDPISRDNESVDAPTSDSHDPYAENNAQYEQFYNGPGEVVSIVCLYVKGQLYPQKLLLCNNIIKLGQNFCNI